MTAVCTIVDWPWHDRRRGPPESRIRSDNAWRPARCTCHTIHNRLIAAAAGSSCQVGSTSCACNMRSWSRVPVKQRADQMRTAVCQTRRDLAAALWHLRPPHRNPRRPEKRRPAKVLQPKPRGSGSGNPATKPRWRVDCACKRAARARDQPPETQKRELDGLTPERHHRTRRKEAPRERNTSEADPPELGRHRN